MDTREPLTLTTTPGGWIVLLGLALIGVAAGLVAAGRGAIPGLEPRVLWEETVTVEDDETTAVPFEVDLPPDLPGSRIGERPPTYWQLTVEAKAEGYEARFLLPVYGR